MENKNDVHKPLVYIEQPTISKPKAPMQHYFESTAEKRTNTTEQPTRQIKMHRRHQPYMQAQRIWEEEETIDSSEEKNFASLTIREKINYLFKRPQFIPTLTCKIETTDGHHYGKIANFKDDIVYLRISQSHATKKIGLDSIDDIHIVGF